MGQHVGVGMSFQPARVRDLDAAEHELAPFRKTVRVVTNPGAIHLVRLAQFEQAVGSDDAEFVRLIAARLHLTWPPADSTRSQPAAMSQRLIPCSM